MTRRNSPIKPLLLNLSLAHLPTTLLFDYLTFKRIRTMSYAHKETVEICKKQDGIVSSYYTATVLAAIARTKYLVRYETRFSEDRTRLLVEPVDEADIRPSPPTNLEVAEKVDAYVNGAWWVGKIVRKVDPNYYVKLDCTGNVVHCPFYKVRAHLEWEDGKWIYPANKPQTDDDQTNASGQGS